MLETGVSSVSKKGAGGESSLALRELSRLCLCIDPLRVIKLLAPKEVADGSCYGPNF